jgi:DNA polymerase III sliding clamp (beta) subunit (PCNA family)
MITDREKLVGILTAVRPGLAKREINEVATHFVFTGEDIITNNDQICIAHPFEAPFKCSVPANELYKIVSSIKTKEISLDLMDGKLKIQGGKTKASLSTTTAETAMAKIRALDMAGVMQKLVALPADFVEGASLCSFSASKDMTHLALTCLLIEDDLIMSSDDLRISRFRMGSRMDCSVLVPAAAIKELVKFPVVDYYVSDKWVYFATKDDVMFCCLLVPDKFNDYDQHFADFDGLELNLPKEMIDMVEAAAVMANGEYDTDKLVDIKIEQGKICCKGSSEVGWIENEADIAFKQADVIKFAINPMFLMAILNHSTKMIYRENRALFDAGKFLHLMALKLD